MICDCSSCKQRDVFGAVVGTARKCCIIERRAGYWCCFSEIFRCHQRIERINENIGKLITRPDSLALDFHFEEKFHNFPPFQSNTDAKY